MTKELGRIILSQSIKGVTVIGLQDTFFQVPPIDGVRYISLSNADLRDFINCNLMVSREESDNPFHFIVMVDTDRTIRGYYDGSKFDEYDRLAAELDIISFENQ